MSRGIRIQAWNSLQVGDYAMIGGEVVRVEALPLSPDADITFESFGGQRQAFLDTSTEAHAIDTPVYKVQIHPPGAKVSPNGLPVAHLYYRNDDGGPGYGKDSVVRFTAPADCEYIALIRDVQGLGGEDYSYRLTVRHRVRLPPTINRAIPTSGGRPVPLTAQRLHGRL